MNDERLLQEISASVNLASLSERIGEPMDLRLRLYSLAIAYSDAQVAETIDGWKITREHLQDQISAKDAEIKRLRDGCKSIFENVNMSMIHPSDIVLVNGWLSQIEQLFKVSPAPVTEGTTEDDSDVWGICCPECYEESLSFLNEYANGIERRCNSCGHVFIEPTKNEDHHE